MRIVLIGNRLHLTPVVCTKTAMQSEESMDRLTSTRIVAMEVLGKGCSVIMDSSSGLFGELNVEQTVVSLRLNRKNLDKQSPARAMNMTVVKRKDSS